MHKSMASAHTVDHSMKVNFNEVIEARKGLDRRHAGSCNACTPFTQVEDYTTVTEVQLRGLTFRLCPACGHKLKLAL